MRVVVVLAACLVAALAAPAPGISPEQMEKSMKMLRNVCMPKTGMTDALVERIKGGELVEERTATCYLACVMTTSMVLKKGTIDTKMFRTQAKKVMDKETATRSIAAVESCAAQVAPQADECDFVLMFLKCVRQNDPSFVIPA